MTKGSVSAFPNARQPCLISWSRKVKVDVIYLLTIGTSNRLTNANLKFESTHHFDKSSYFEICVRLVSFEAI